MFGFNIPRVDALVIALAVFFMGGLHLIVHRTRMGTAMRAVAEDAEAAALMGVDVNKVIVFTFILGGAMAGIAGVFYAFVYKQVYFYMGFTPGIESVRRRGAGRHTETFRALCWAAYSSAWWNRSGRPCSWMAWASRRPINCAIWIAFTLLIMVLVFRPQGLLREKMAKKRAGATARPRPPELRAVLIGLVFGAIAVHLAIVGVLLMIHQRWIVIDTLSLGQATLVTIGLGAGAMAATRVAQPGAARV